MLLVYLRIAASVLCTMWHAPGAQRWRRGAFGLAILTVVPILLGINHAALALDHIFYPGFRKFEIRRPLFIIGNLRTGSSYLYRLLARDRDTFACLRIVDFIFPSVIQKRVVRHLFRLDRRLGGHAYRLLKWADARLVSAYAHIHPTGLFVPEEDELILLNYLASAAVFESFPKVRRFRRFLYTDQEMDPPRSLRDMRRYRELIRRHLYHVGGDRILLSKNPLFTCKIAAMQTVFPDARFLNLTRNPLQVVPSTAGLFHFVWRRSGALPPEGVDANWVLELCDAYYRHPGPHLASLGDRALTLRYDDLLTHTRHAVEMLLSRFGYPLTPALDTAMDQEVARARGYRSQHRYSLDQWGLTVPQIVERYADVFEEHGFQRE